MIFATEVLFLCRLEYIYFVVCARMFTDTYKSSGMRWRNGYRIL